MERLFLLPIITHPPEVTAVSSWFSCFAHSSLYIYKNLYAEHRHRIFIAIHYCSFFANIEACDTCATV